MANRPGRPRIDFDLEVVEGLGRIGATIHEMAQILPASERTVSSRLAEREGDFSRAYERGRAWLATSLRRKQIQVALTGNTTMLIWLGKQLLQQRDRAETTNLDIDVEKLSDKQLERIVAGEDPEYVVRTPDTASRFPIGETATGDSLG